VGKKSNGIFFSHSFFFAGGEFGSADFLPLAQFLATLRTLSTLISLSIMCPLLFVNNQHVHGEHSMARESRKLKIRSHCEWNLILEICHQQQQQASAR
jgi:hypothetical protein